MYTAYGTVYHVHVHAANQYARNVIVFVFVLVQIECLVVVYLCTKYNILRQVLVLVALIF